MESEHVVRVLSKRAVVGGAMTDVGFWVSVSFEERERVIEMNAVESEDMNHEHWTHWSGGKIGDVQCPGPRAKGFPFP